MQLTKVQNPKSPGRGLSKDYPVSKIWSQRLQFKVPSLKSVRSLKSTVCLKFENRNLMSEVRSLVWSLNLKSEIQNQMSVRSPKSVVSSLLSKFEVRSLKFEVWCSKSVRSPTSEVGVWSPTSEVWPKFVWSISEVWKLPDVCPKSAVRQLSEIWQWRLKSDVWSMFEDQNPKSEDRSLKSTIRSLMKKQKSEVWCPKFVRGRKTVWSRLYVLSTRLRMSVQNLESKNRSLKSKIWVWNQSLESVNSLKNLKPKSKPPKSKVRCPKSV